MEEMGRQQKELMRDAEVGKAIRDIKSPAAKRTVGVELMKRSVFLWKIVQFGSCLAVEVASMEVRDQRHQCDLEATGGLRFGQRL